MSLVQVAPPLKLILTLALVNLVKLGRFSPKWTWEFSKSMLQNSVKENA